MISRFNPKRQNASSGAALSSPRASRDDNPQHSRIHSGKYNRIGEHAIIAQGAKQYRVEWKDYNEMSWTAQTTIDEKCQPWLDCKARKKAETVAAAAIANIAADLLSIFRDHDTGHMRTSWHQGARCHVHIHRSAMRNLRNSRTHKPRQRPPQNTV